MREVSVWTFRAVAVTVAGLVLLAVARARGQSLLIPRRHRVRISVATFFYLVLWNIASTYSAILIPSGQSAVLGFTMPLWSALISWAVLGERLGGRLVLAVALGAAAVTLLMVPSFASYAQAPLGLALGLLAGIGWAVGTLILKRGTGRCAGHRADRLAIADQRRADGRRCASSSATATGSCRRGNRSP